MSENVENDKRAELKRKKRHRTMVFRRIKIGAVACAFLAVVLFLLSAYVFFHVNTVEVVGAKGENGEYTKGSKYYTSEQIADASGVNIGESLVLVNKGDIEETIEKKLPYIGSVTVKRCYPDTLRLIVEDTSAAYAVKTNSVYILLDKDLKVLNTAAKKIPEGCAELSGVKISKAEVGVKVQLSDSAYEQRINTLTSTLEKAGVKKVTAFDFSNMAAIKAVYDGKVTVIFGTLTDLDFKIKTAIKTINEEYKNNPSLGIIIDVSDSAKAYVRDDIAAEETSEAPVEPTSNSE